MYPKDSRGLRDLGKLARNQVASVFSPSTSCCSIPTGASIELEDALVFETTH